MEQIFPDLYDRVSDRSTRYDTCAELLVRQGFLEGFVQSALNDGRAEVAHEALSYVCAALSDSCAPNQYVFAQAVLQNLDKNR